MSERLPSSIPETRNILGTSLEKTKAIDNPTVTREQINAALQNLPAGALELAVRPAALSDKRLDLVEKAALPQAIKYVREVRRAMQELHQFYYGPTQLYKAGKISSIPPLIRNVMNAPTLKQQCTLMRQYKTYMHSMNQIAASIGQSEAYRQMEKAFSDEADAAYMAMQLPVQALLTTVGISVAGAVLSKFMTTAIALRVASMMPAGNIAANSVLGRFLASAAFKKVSGTVTNMTLMLGDDVLMLYSTVGEKVTTAIKGLAHKPA